ncbi:MAG TPA: thioredoxin domain-containing protein [Solirubrobacteraceae bacterium]|nr:thioredoxin domain-containing protein [Solirubrobacteraceae bacterium]
MALVTGAATLVVTNREGAHSAPTQVAEAQIDHEVSTLLAGIPQHGNTLGQPTAPFTLEIFADLECLTAKNWVVLLLPAIIQDFVRTDILQIQYRSLETDTLRSTVFVGQQTAALAAGMQKKMWNFIEIFYHEQKQEYTDYVTADYLDNIADQIPGLVLAQWNQDRSIRLARQVVADNNTARQLGFRGTPSFLIGRTGGRMEKLGGRRVVIDILDKLTSRRLEIYLIEPEDIAEALKRLP